MINLSWVDSLGATFQKGADIVGIVGGSAEVVGLNKSPESNIDAVKSNDKNVAPDSKLSGDNVTSNVKSMLTDPKYIAIGGGVLALTFIAYMVMKK